MGVAVNVRYLGWSGFEFRPQAGRSILVDPFLTGRPQDEIPQSPVALADLTDVAAVIVSHGAFDHVGDSLDIMVRNPSALLICGADVKALAMDTGIPELSIAVTVPGSRVMFGETLSIKALQAAHLSSTVVAGRIHPGPAMSYLLDFSQGPRVFHGGDTALSSEHALYGTFYRPEVAMLGVGGAVIAGRQVDEMNPAEALQAALMLGVRTVVPMHYHGREGADLERLVLASRGELRCLVPSPGDWFELA